ncbi:MAG: endonuclease Q family protein [Halanaerobiaceae bacterium]
MNEYFCDLHIHIGQANGGQPVKITASRKLNFARIAREATVRKGLDLVGVIDCASPPVISDIESLLDAGKMEELVQGGISYRDDLVIIPGAEVESKEKDGGQAHYLAYFPHLEQIKEFSQIMKQYITNINLSSQATGLTGQELFTIVDGLGGIFIPAHAFTPHKSFYGKCVSSYKEVFTEKQWQQIPAIELGLSADSFLANKLGELTGKSFLSNSDAHSHPKIAREYNKIKMETLNFKEFKKALEQKNGRKITGNFGMDPRLGKYHRSFCPDCEKSFAREKPVLQCPVCGRKNLVVGVKDRVLKITRGKETKEDDFPLYVHQVPLLDIPGIGSKTLEKLLEEFNTEMNILHQTSFSELQEVVGSKLAQKIIDARTGKLSIKQGGGGHYGKVMG